MDALALGLMSGTSMDGIDVTIMNPESKKIYHANTIPYKPHIVDKLRQVMEANAFDMNFFAKLHREVGMAFADAAYQALEYVGKEIASQVQVIGSHGQTICHHIDKQLSYTWQIGCPYAILNSCHIPVVYDFRSKNVAQGGQGAPLAPLFHEELFGKNSLATAVINIGGISNISLIVKDKPLLGFDLGPGNCLMDAWIYKQQKIHYDNQGQWAQEGKVITSLLNQMLDDPFINKEYPKSIGKEYFSMDWLEKKIADNEYHPEDIQATLLAYTAKVIANQVLRLLPSPAPIYICGGGAKNIFLLNSIQNFLPNYSVKSIDSVGFSSEHLEAMMIAWLAWKRVNNHLFDLSVIMGGKDKQLLGIICS